MILPAASAEPTVPQNWQLGPFLRPVDKPVISPNPDSMFDCPMRKQPVSWEAADTFNPAAVVYQGKVCVLYRAEDDATKGLGHRTSRIGLAVSEDGIHFQRRPAPVFYPDEDAWKEYEWTGGAEDPRVVEGPDGTFYMYYTMWNLGNPKRVARLGVASSKDLVTWTKHGPIFNDHERVLNDWHKSASVVTSLQDGRLKAVKVNGNYLMYWGEHAVHLATSEDLIHWQPLLNEKGGLKALITPRHGHFDSIFTECGPPALLTEKGILLIYNGKNNGSDPTLGNGAYAAGQVLFDSADPLKVLARTDTAFFRPEMDFEKSGQYREGTVFTEGLVYFKNQWWLYYGTADSFVGVAVAK